MELYEWEIWHTYSSFMRTRDIDLISLAEVLVRQNIAELVLHRDGHTFWRGKNGIGRGETLVNLESSEKSGRITILPEDDQQPELTGFAFEAWYQGAHFRFNEKRVFHPDSDLPPQYIRAYLGQCNLINEKENKQIIIYPVVIIYATGVVIVEFRTISPDVPHDLYPFIKDKVNLFQHRFDRVEVAAGLVRLAPRAWYETKKSCSFCGRVSLLLLERHHDIAVQKAIKCIDGGDFEFELAPLPPPPGQGERLETFALTIMHVCAYLVAIPRKGFSFLFLGQKQIPKVATYWVGRPHIYLIDFKGQKETAEENLITNKAAFASMLSRTILTESQISDEFFPHDSRLFSDYNALIDKSASLWVWSISGKRQQEKCADLNRAHLIYEQQAVIELLEYGYMLHHIILAKATGLSCSMDVLKAREDLLNLDARIDRAAPSGETRRLLYSGWERYGMATIRKQIREALAVRGEKASFHEQRRALRLSLGIAILFGLVAVPALATQVLEPLWGWFDFSRPTNQDAFSTMLNLFSFFVVGIIIVAIFWRTNRI